MPLNVYLIPGFGASDLGILATGQVLWWDTSNAIGKGLGPLRLAPNGVDPGPPDGLQIGVDPNPQTPWDLIKAALQRQLPAVWNPQVGPYDWRLDPHKAAASLADSIRAHSTLDSPATIVGHSAGGLVAVLAWANLAVTGDTGKVRRIITICSPFQGSFLPVLWMSGNLPMVQTLLQYGAAFQSLLPPAPNLVAWQLGFLATLSLTWPMFYALMPSLLGTEGAKYPNRKSLYSAGNYPKGLQPSQAWLDWAKDTFQPEIAGNSTFPPPWVMTTVGGSGIETAVDLTSALTPVNLDALRFSDAGDGVVTTESALRAGSFQVTRVGDHSSIPLAMANDTSLAGLIIDPRGPPSPAPPPVFLKQAVPYLVSDPPDPQIYTGITCIAGG